MKTENTNDFSKCRVGDKLWSIQLGDCEVKGIFLSYIYVLSEYSGNSRRYCPDGRAEDYDRHQSLFFSNPNIIAPPEPPRLPDYKPGQWIAVWHGNNAPCIRIFTRFAGNKVICASQNCDGEFDWDNHCTLEELPEVLAKWGDQK